MSNYQRVRERTRQTGPIDAHRAIIYSDMSVSSASVEQREFLELYGRPVCVGDDEHGIILTASYEAKHRRKTAQALRMDHKTCPEAVSIPPHRYQYCSRMVREIYCDFSDRVKPFDLDKVWITAANSAELAGGVLRLIVQGIDIHTHLAHRCHMCDFDCAIDVLDSRFANRAVGCLCELNTTKLSGIDLEQDNIIHLVSYFA